jgi:hydroxymethylpyrimidine/phosphomethylpyrimidine kinase
MSNSINVQIDTSPVLLSINISDPSGGSGIQADIESATYLGCHCASVVTIVTTQDTCSLKDSLVLSPILIIEQARAILEDMPVKAIKVGGVANIEQIMAISTLLGDYPQLPLVLEPSFVWREQLVERQTELLDALREMLCTQAEVVVINSVALAQLTQGADSIDACAQDLMAQGASYVLGLSINEGKETTINRLYGYRRHVEDFPAAFRLCDYHGAQCTLSASITALLAQGMPMPMVVRQSQIYTHNALTKARRLGMGKPIPKRGFYSVDQ